MLQQGDTSAPLGSSSADANAATASAAAATGGFHDGGGCGEAAGSNNSAGEEDSKARGDEGVRSFGGNRWPGQETLALLKIRSDMDQVFRDSSLKGPLWEEVSRKLAELGYNRSAKKCKEKFENVYKYHKRTKEGRTGKPEGKHYKFFDQLEALELHHQSHSILQAKSQASIMQATSAIPWSINPPNSVTHISVSSTAANPISIVPPNTVTPPAANPTAAPFPHAVNSFPNVPANLFSSSTSSSTASDEEYSEERGTKRKRKWKDFFKRLTKEVIKKQEQLQIKFLEEIERRERDRIVREEAWRIQEMARINREHEILIQERSTAAAKDAAVIAFLQRISGQQQNPVRENPQPTPVQLAPTVQPQPQPQPHLQPQPQPQLPPPQPLALGKTYDLHTTPSKPAANGENVIMSSSSRWPKAEVQALIKFRTDLANKYHENGPKGPLWEEISAAMRNIGFYRNAKRCKEKWENINKYFKRVKESNKKRPDNSKTCPYYSQLDALYKEKSKRDQNSPGYGTVKAVNYNMAPLMVQPERQWPLHQQENQPPLSDQIQEEEEEEEEEDIGESEEEYEEGNEDYEIVANKAATAAASTGKTQ